MAIRSIEYKKGFQISLVWPKGVQETVLYALPRGSEPLSEDELLSIRNDSAVMTGVCGFAYRAGIGSIQYSPNDPKLNARWIDIWFCDFDAAGEIAAHSLAGSFFNGDCVVSVKIACSRVSDRMQAVNITVQNLSSFAIEAGGIGYRVGGRCFAIPLALRQGQLRELPQFEIPRDAVVEMHRFDDKYPARFVPLTD